MSPHPLPTKQTNGHHNGLDRLSSPPSDLRTSPRDVQLERGDTLSQNIRSRDQSESPASWTTTDLGTLSNLAGRPRQSPPSSYPWLGEEDLRIVGTHPIDSGGFADVWMGEVGGRKVAVKSYRCYLSANCTLTHTVRDPHPSWGIRTDGQSTEVSPRSFGMCPPL